MAVVIDNDGHCLACEHGEDDHTEANDNIARALSQVTSAMEKLAVELELATGRSCLPLEGWSLMSQKLFVIMGDGGFRGVVMETSQPLEDLLTQDFFSLMAEEVSAKRVQISEHVRAVKG